MLTCCVDTCSFHNSPDRQLPTLITHIECQTMYMQLNVPKLGSLHSCLQLVGDRYGQTTVQGPTCPVGMDIPLVTPIHESKYGSVVCG